jgi:hypothetical protein
LLTFRQSRFQPVFCIAISFDDPLYTVRSSFLTACGPRCCFRGACNSWY